MLVWNKKGFWSKLDPGNQNCEDFWEGWET